MVKLPDRIFGDRAEPLRVGFRRRLTATTVEPFDLTGQTVLLAIRPATSGTNLSEFNGLDISASIVGSATEGNVDHYLTAPQAAQLVAGAYVGQLRTVAGGGEPNGFPNDTELDPTAFQFNLTISPSFF